MTMTIEGEARAAGLRIGVAVASWNRAVTERLLEGALRRLRAMGDPEVTVIRVPGALEIPVAALGLARAGCDAIVAIATVIRGETDHYEIVVREAAGGIARVALDTGVPVANAILAVPDIETAVARSGPGPDNRGAEAAEAAVFTVNALRRLAEA